MTDKNGNNPVNPKARSTYITVALSVLVVIVVMIFFMTATVSVTMVGDTIVIKATSANAEIPVSEIEEIELLSEIPASSRVFGYGSTRISSGVFSSDVYGQFTRATYNTVPSCILVKTNEGKYYLFNLQDAGGTQLFYTRISQYMNK